MRADHAIDVVCRDMSTEFPWLSSGKIESITVEYNGIRTFMCAYKNSSDVYYLNGSLKNITYLIKSEVKGDMVDFIKTKLGRLFTYVFLTAYERVLDENYLRSYIWQLAMFTGDKLELHTRSLDTIKYYCTGVTAEVKRGFWEIKFNSIESDGKIKQWEYHGQVYPFSITGVSTRVGNKGRSVPTIMYVK